MKKSISIRLVKDDNGEICFKYSGSDVARTPYGLTSLLEDGIKTGRMNKGSKIEDSKYVKYVFNYYETNEIKAMQKPTTMVIRMRKDYIDSAYDILKSLDSLCMETNYIRTKNIARILGISLAATVFLSFSGKMIADRIKSPDKNDFGRNNEYTAQKQIDDSNYYKELEEQAKNGDEKAKEEYAKYLVQRDLFQAYNEIDDNNKKTI